MGRLLTWLLLLIAALALPQAGRADPADIDAAARGVVRVVIVGSDGKVSSRPVETGRRQDGRVEIVSGLDAATRVVAKGGAFLSEGAAVRVVAALYSS